MEPERAGDRSHGAGRRAHRDPFRRSLAAALELLARVRALLRRSTIGQADIVEAGPLVVDHRARQVRVGAVAVQLSGREYELVAKLASDPQRVFTKSELLRDVWGIRGNGIRTRTVDSHASRLRRKLEAVGADGVVVNQWGVVRYVEGDGPK